MRSREFGRTGRTVSEIGFGAWAIGAGWGLVDEADALAALNAALDRGVTFIDTADVYGDGRSERLIARVLKERGGDRPFVATKAGRRLPAQTVAGYTRENLNAWIDRSLKNLEVDRLDLVQLHCPPTDLYYHAEVFGHLDDLVKVGKIADYGVSVERVEEALKAIEFPGVVSVQIIFNIFRLRPADVFFDLAKKKQAAIVARVPLASGCCPASSRPTRSSTKATIASSTGMAKLSTSARPFRACPTRSGSRRSRKSARWSEAGRWRNSRCAGS